MAENVVKEVEVTKPSKARFGIANPYSVEVGESAHIDAFTFETYNDNSEMNKDAVHTSTVQETEEVNDFTFLITTMNTYYICFNRNARNTKCYFATTSEVPVVGKKIEVIGLRTDWSYDWDIVFFRRVVPEKVIDRFAEFGCYIIESEDLVYFCYDRTSLS